MKGFAPIWIIILICLLALWATIMTLWWYDCDIELKGANVKMDILEEYHCEYHIATSTNVIKEIATTTEYITEYILSDCGACICDTFDEDRETFDNAITGLKNQLTDKDIEILGKDMEIKEIKGENIKIQEQWDMCLDSL